MRRVAERAEGPFVLLEYLFNAVERREGVDRAKLLPAETSWRGGKWPRGVVRTFAGRTSAILGTRSALYLPHCARALSLLLASSFLRHACIYIYIQSEKVFPGIE